MLTVNDNRFSVLPLVTFVMYMILWWQLAVLFQVNSRPTSPLLLVKNFFSDTKSPVRVSFRVKLLKHSEITTVRDCGTRVLLFSKPTSV